MSRLPVQEGWWHDGWPRCFSIDDTNPPDRHDRAEQSSRCWQKIQHLNVLSTCSVLQLESERVLVHLSGCYGNRSYFFKVLIGWIGPFTLSDDKSLSLPVSSWCDKPFLSLKLILFNLFALFCGDASRQTWPLWCNISLLKCSLDTMLFLTEVMLS